MNGWVVLSAAGALFAVGVVVALIVVSKAVMRTAQNASDLMTAMEQVQRQTAVLAQLEAYSRNAGDVAGRTTAALEELQRRAAQAPTNGTSAPAEPQPSAPPPTRRTPLFPPPPRGRKDRP